MAARTRRPPRGCLPALVALLVVFAGLAFAVHRALDPASLRVLAEARLSAALGQKVTIGTIEVDWLPAPSVEAREIALGATGGTAPPSLTLGSIRIVPRLSSLVSRPIVAERVELVGLVVHALRDRQGRWQLPLPMLPAAGRDQQAGIEVGEVVLREGLLSVTDEGRPQGGREAPSVRDISARVRRDGPLMRLEDLSAAIGESAVSGSGSAGPEGLRVSLAWSRLRAGDLPEVLGLAGIEATPGTSVEGDRPLTLDVVIDRSGAFTASGRVTAARATFQLLDLSKLQSPLQLADNRLVLDPVTFTAYGGSQRGRITARLDSRPIRWVFDTRIDGVDLRQLVNDTTTVPDSLSGTGMLRGRLEGVVLEPMLDRATGRMEVVLTKGTIHNFPLLAAVNAALQVAEGDTRDLRFETLTATMAVANGKAVTDDLVVRSGGMTVTASGTLGFDRSLDFKGRVTLSREKVAELAGRQKEVARLKNSDGEIELPVIVSGTVTEPRYAVDVASLLKRGLQDELKRRLKKWGQVLHFSILAI
jgi:uncharacterized protein involved in outer membrane biogenesis